MSQLPQSLSELLGRWTRHYCLAPLAGAVLSGKYTLVPTMIAALRTKSDRPQESWVYWFELTMRAETILGGAPMAAFIFLSSLMLFLMMIAVLR